MRKKVQLYSFNLFYSLNMMTQPILYFNQFLILLRLYVFVKNVFHVSLYSLRNPSVTPSVILKFGPKVAADPTTPLQDILKKNKGQLPSPLGEAAQIASISIIRPGNVFLIL